MSELSRLIGVFFEPKKTFEDIARRPSWFVPLLLMILVGVGYIALYSQHIGWEQLLRQQIAGNSRAQQLSAQQIDQAVATQVRLAPVFGYSAAVIGPPFVDIIIAAVLLAIVAGIMSAPLKYNQVFAVVCYANLPGLISAALGAVVMFLKNPQDFDLRNPLMFNAGAFMDPEHSGKFVYTLATSIDLFTFWVILLMATGLKAAAGQKLSFGGALFSVALPWLVWVLGKSALAGAFS